MFCRPVDISRTSEYNNTPLMIDFTRSLRLHGLNYYDVSYIYFVSLNICCRSIISIVSTVEYKLNGNSKGNLSSNNKFKKHMFSNLFNKKSRHKRIL